MVVVVVVTVVMDVVVSSSAIGKVLRSSVVVIVATRGPCNEIVGGRGKWGRGDGPTIIFELKVGHGIKFGKNFFIDKMAGFSNLFDKI